MSETFLSTAEEKADRFMELFRTRNLDTEKYEAMRSLLTTDVIITMAAHPQKWISLHMIPNRLHPSDQLDFSYRVYSAAGQIPKRELLNLWSREIPALEVTGRELKKYENPLLLVDYPCVRKILAETKQFRDSFAGYKAERVSLPAELKTAIREDSGPEFSIYREMFGMKMSLDLLRIILHWNACNIFRCLLYQQDFPECIRSISDLCILCVTELQDGFAIMFLKILEEYQPGCLKDCRDSLGRNLLWHTIYNETTVWFHPLCRLTFFLLEQGCSPDNCNQIGLSWRYVCRNMTYESKCIRQSRYSWRLRLAFQQKKLLPVLKEEEIGALDIVAGWTETAVIRKDFGLRKLQKLTRSGSREPLTMKIRKELRDRLIETHWHYLYIPQATLPESWKDSILESGTFHCFEKPLSAQDCAVMASYHHPLAGMIPGGSYGSGLSSIPLKNSRKVQYANEYEEAIAILKTGLLVYHPWVRDYFVRQQCPGYRILRYIGWAKYLNYPFQDTAIP